MPSESEIEKARRRLEDALEKHGLLLVHDLKFPSATAVISGEAIRGSWWGHPKGKLIYEVLEQIDDSVAWTKLVLGKETLVHRRLWPALVAAAESRQAWQLRGLSADAQRLLRRVRGGDPVRTDADRKPAAFATELERRLLARGYREHTAAGHHVRFLETWGAWGRRNGVVAADLPDATEAIAALSAPVIVWLRDRRPPGLLPWLAAR